jgi:hypothetical protein
MLRDKHTILCKSLRLPFWHKAFLNSLKQLFTLAIELYVTIALCQQAVAAGKCHGFETVLKVSVT